MREADNPGAANRALSVFAGSARKPFLRSIGREGNFVLCHQTLPPLAGTGGLPDIVVSPTTVIQQHEQVAEAEADMEAKAQRGAVPNEGEAHQPVGGAFDEYDGARLEAEPRPDASAPVMQIEAMELQRSGRAEYRARRT